MTPPNARNNNHTTPSMHMLCHQAPVIPVLTINDLAHAVPLAEALVAGGLPVLEVTLRTPTALQAISLMARVPGATIGAGTTLNPRNAREAHQAGATFASSPGATRQVIDACKDHALPLLPGAASPTEITDLVNCGFDLIKLFPASAGGPATLRSLSAPFPKVHFIPTGGISQDDALDYLALPNVACVGGSWVAPAQMIQEEHWGGIRKLAHQARLLGNGH